MKNKKKQKLNFRNAIPKVKDGKNSSVYTYKFGNKTVKLTVQKVEVPAKQDPSKSVFYYSCLSCKNDFDGDMQVCPGCGKPVTRINLRKCPQCGAKNNPARARCLMCNASFPKLEVAATGGIETVMRLDAGGMIYKSTDQSLTPRMKKLFEDLASSGFSKASLEPWVNSHEAHHPHDPYIRESMGDEYDHMVQEYKYEKYIFACIAILTLIGTLLFIRVYWFN